MTGRFPDGYAVFKQSRWEEWCWPYTVTYFGQMVGVRATMWTACRLIKGHRRALGKPKFYDAPIVHREDR
jgi:hypothetical protein